MEWKPGKCLLGLGLLVSGWGLTHYLSRAYAEPIGYGFYSSPGWVWVPWLLSLAVVSLYPEKIRYKMILIAIMSVILGHFKSYEEGVTKEAFTILYFLKHGLLNAVVLSVLMGVVAFPLMVVSALWRRFFFKR